MDYQIMNYKVFIITLLLFQTKSAVAEETFENSTNLCSTRCSCNFSNDNLTFYIDCNNKSMKHTIANWPENPKNLVATFSYNEIVTLERMPGSDAESIQLVFSNCKIKYLNTGLFESTVNIKFVDLSFNELESDQLSSDVFKGPYNNSMYEPIALEHLDLSYNELHSLHKNLFEHTPHLKYLNLEGNEMRVIDHVTCLALAKVPQIQEFNLAGNRLTELPSDAVKHFPNLTYLNLALNELDFVPQSLGFVAESLQILNISYNPIIEFEHDTFEGMENLLKLFANYLYELTVVRARAFTPLKHLKVLELSHNEKLLDIDEQAFDKIDKIEEVYLNGNGLKTLSPSLLPWLQIKMLDIRDNEFMCNCDLYNISQQLSSPLKTGINAPLCLDPLSYMGVEIDALTNETCSFKTLKRRRGARIHGDLRVMRMTLTILIVVLIMAAAVAMWLGYSKWRTYQRSSHYPFPSQVIYSPVATGDFSRF